jgi:alpha-aminoadipate/glutamate carrier protein LysW
MFQSTIYNYQEVPVAPEFATCPVCKQRLALQDYVVVGTEVVCANCETNLRVENRRPLRLAPIPIEETFNSDSRPESYG